MRYKIWVENIKEQPKMSKPELTQILKNIAKMFHQSLDFIRLCFKEEMKYANNNVEVAISNLLDSFNQD
jgi:hypothetical protein